MSVCVCVCGGGGWVCVCVGWVSVWVCVYNINDVHVYGPMDSPDLVDLFGGVYPLARGNHPHFSYHRWGREPHQVHMQLTLCV